MPPQLLGASVGKGVGTSTAGGFGWFVPDGFLIGIGVGDSKLGISIDGADG
jgi:hypothetical protein